MERLRQLIVSVVGHVDHGKSSLLDKIRGSCIVDTEAGKITQAIGASLVPEQTINSICGEQLGGKMKIPGLLFIDTPGHAAFTSLRKRGGALADMAVLVVDINEGFKPQTIEALEILKQGKVPFLVAANKVDLVPGWNNESKGVIQNQSSNALQLFDQKMYLLVGSLFEQGFQSERFDRLTDFTKQVAIVPVSAITGQGLSELLMTLVGLAQKFLTARLTTEDSSIARGTILEIKEITGLGIVLDSIIYNGSIHKGDILLVGTVNGVAQSKVKALLEPTALCEIRDKKTGFENVEEAHAAAAVRIVAPNMECAVAGMPLIGLSEASQVEDAKAEVEALIKKVMLDVEGTGVVVRADSLGSLEALLIMLHEKKISVKSASIGNISKRDLCEAESNLESDPLAAVVLGFNVKITKEAEPLLENSEVRVVLGDIIYGLIDQYEKWLGERKRQLQQKELEKLVQPCSARILPGYVFRESNPAIFGVEVVAGLLKLDMPIMSKDGKHLSEIKSIQENQDNLKEAAKNKQVAVSVPKVMIGRQLNEGDIIYSAIPEEDFKKFKELKHLLTHEQKQLLKEIAEIMRKVGVFWGV